MSEHIIKEKNLVVRHSLLELIEHWAIAVSGIILFFSGLFQMPLSKRYGISKIPGLEWSADFMFTLKIHYIASVVFVGAALFHIIYHGMLKETGMLPKKGDIRQSIDVIKTFFGMGEEPPFHKYLPEQRLAYIGMALIIAGLIITGLIKVVKNVYMPDMPLTVVSWATTLHNIFFILFFLAFLAHMAAIIIKPNRPMVRGIFTGRVRLDYARHRHPLWLAEVAVSEHPDEPQARTRTDFDARAASWDENPDRVALCRAITDAILREVPLTGETELMDYGAGTGLVTLGLQPYVKNITAADNSEAMLGKLSEKILTNGISNVKTLQVDLEKETPPNLQFDVIVASMVMHHVMDVKAMISILSGMLRPGGYLAIADLDSDGGEFHRDPSGVMHEGFERKQIIDLFIAGNMLDVKTATAFMVTRDVRNKGPKEFSIFLISGRKGES